MRIDIDRYDEGVGDARLTLRAWLRGNTRMMFGDDAAVMWSWCLAHNLAIGAALCAAFDMGRDVGPGPHIPWKTAWWRPGCGRPWEWPHVTRDDGEEP